jgi:thiamine biosynthesis lipoprotein
VRRETSLRFENGAFRGSFLAMGSPCELLIDTDDRSTAATLSEIASTEAWRIEDKFSRYLDGNIVDRINRSEGKPTTLDPETTALVDFAAMLFDSSDGRFDITSGVLREAWTFDGSDNVPDPSSVERVMSRVGWDRVRWAAPVLTMQPGMEIDFGGIAKEYAVDKAAGLVMGETDVACLVNFGGDLVATSSPGATDGWRVGVDAVGGESVKRIRLARGGLATSGDARRFLLKDGVRYSHILDPTTGWPVRNAPRSITVAADTCTQAGMLATLAMLRGPDAESFLDEQGVRHWTLR